jgi:hypothetical protein
MGIIGKDFKYKKINNLLDKNLINFFKYYFKFRHQIDNQINLFNADKITAGDSQHYSDMATESLLINLKSKIEKNVGKKLLPTYSFWRMYTYGSYLKKHKDRPSCEISVTINIMGDTDWPIYIEDKEIFLKPGDGVVYLGCELNHERKKLKGDHQAQIFLHYVEEGGKNQDYIFDKRFTLGLPLK